MKPRNLAKATGGLASIVVLLLLLFLDTTDPGVQLSLQDKILLLSLIASLLGLDMLLEQLPGIGSSAGDSSDDGGSDSE